MRYLYSALLGLAMLLLLPYFLWQGLSKGKYLSNLRERFGGKAGAWPKRGGRVVWLHAVSVGEVQAARPLCRELKRRQPDLRLFVTTTTATGQAVARAQLVEADLVGYFPFDWGWVVNRVLDRIEPELVILMESELWFNFLSECHKRNISVVVVNGRISDRSFRRARRARFFTRRLYRLVTWLVMQSEVDAARAITLGAVSGRVMVAGNLKYDVGAGTGLKGGAGSVALSILIGPEGGPKSPLIVAGSTHPGEEEVLLRAFSRLRGSGMRMLIAPRHPERFGEVAALIEAAGFSMVRRSVADEVSEAWRADVILLDTIGELALVYDLATIVFVGGSLVPVGGHNILEPALAGRPIVVGPYMHNFREVTADFLRANALIQVRVAGSEEQAERLREVFELLRGDPLQAQELGERARLVIEANRGATVRTGDLVAGLLKAS